MLEKLKLMLRSKEEEKKNLVARSEKSEDVNELRSIHGAFEKLNAEIEELRGMIREAETTQAKETEQKPDERTAAVNGEEAETKENRSFQPGKGFEKRDGAELELSEKRAKEQEYEKRGKDLRENRTVTLSAQGVLLQQHQATSIKPTFNQVSSLVDLVNWKPLNGGESYKQPYVKDYGEAGYTKEGGDPTTTEPTFGYAKMVKSKITAYAEITEEMEKLPAAAYAQEVEKALRIALRKKIAAEILIGDGTVNSEDENEHMTGIFRSSTIQSESDIAVTEITNTTLDDIIFSYGGDENVEDAACLILNKKDLKAFSQLRTKDGKKFHSIVSRGNTGTIDGIPYVINSRCAAVSDAKVTADAWCMAYGPLSQYDIAEFSALEIRKSTDYKFKQGMTAYRGVIMLGGNVVAHNGFLRVKKGGASTPGA